MHFNLASSTVWSTTFLCVYWPCFLLPFSLSSFSVLLSLFFCIKTPSPQLLPTDCTPHNQLFLLSSSPLCHSCYYYNHSSLHPPNPLSSQFIAPNLDITHKLKTQQKHNIGTSLVSPILPSSVLPLPFFPPPHLSFLFFLLCHAVRILSSSCPLFILFVPPCLSFLHGTVAFLWTSLPVACGHVPTPLHCPPLRSVSFPLSPVPYPPLAPCPAAPPAVSKERYATLPLYSFRYVIILSSPFLLLLLPGKVGMSCLMLLALFFNHWWLVIRLQGYEGLGCLFWGLYDLFWLLWVCVRKVRWEHHTKLQHFILIFNSSGLLSMGKKHLQFFIFKEHNPSIEILPRKIEMWGSFCLGMRREANLNSKASPPGKG